MQFYEFGDALRPLGEKAPEKWENVLALLEPSELSAVTLPDTLTPPLTSDSVYGSQLCALLTDQNGITGHIRIPARGSQAARRFAFSWSQGNVQEVLADNTDRFIHRMSAIRKEVSRADRFYAQLADFGASLLEEADDLFDKRSTRRMNYFLRRVEALKNETERLREYAMQVSGEYQSQVDIAQNRVMQLLTIVTTIFLPLSLIVGWYGMNFDMPELSWEYGYPVVIVLAVVIVAVLIRYFKRKKWF